MAHRFTRSLLFVCVVGVSGCVLQQAQFADAESRCAQSPGACKQMCETSPNSTECAVATVETAETIASQGNPGHLSGPSLGELRRQLLIICNRGVKRACSAYAQVGDTIMKTAGGQQASPVTAVGSTPPPGQNGGTIPRTPAPLAWVQACSRVAHIHLVNTGQPVYPMALAAPSLSCVAVLGEADISVANATVACIQATQSLSCLDRVGGLAALARPMQ